MRISYINNSAEFVAPMNGRQDNEARILKMLAYFDVFQYPLTKHEIIQYVGKNQQELTIERKLKELLSRRVIYLHLGFYSFHNNPILAYRRAERNKRAVRILPGAFSIGKFLFRFPFVSAVAISGSLSKNFADTEGDIEFFIITKANRLWIARTLMLMANKFAFLSGKRHCFYKNHFIDEEAMLSGIQNIFTAIEIATLIPVSGKTVIDNFFDINHWSRQFFSTTANRNLKVAANRYWLKKFLEMIFDNSIGNRLDNWLFELTARRLSKKNKKLTRNKGCDMMNVTMSKHILQSHPHNLQDKALSMYNQKLSELKLS